MIAWPRNSTVSACVRLMHVRTVFASGLMLACAVVLGGCTGEASDGGDPGSEPVLVRMERSGGPYPAAQIRGLLTMRDGCLLIDDAVAVWPAESTWDPQDRTVSFAGDFEEANPVVIGEVFVGGGSAFDGADAMSGILDGPGQERLADCVKDTKATGVVLALPPTGDVSLAARQSLTRLQHQIFQALVRVHAAEFSATAVDPRAGVVRVWLARNVKVHSFADLEALLQDPDVVLRRTLAGTRPAIPEEQSG